MRPQAKLLPVPSGGRVAGGMRAEGGHLFPGGRSGRAVNMGPGKHGADRFFRIGRTAIPPNSLLSFNHDPPVGRHARIGGQRLAGSGGKQQGGFVVFGGGNQAATGW